MGKDGDGDGTYHLELVWGAIDPGHWPLIGHCAVYCMHHVCIVIGNFRFSFSFIQK